MSRHPIFATCGSDNLVSDAWAEWDKELGEWGLRTVFDDLYCDSCGAENDWVWLYDPEPTRSKKHSWWKCFMSINER